MARLSGQLLKRALVSMIAPMAFLGLYGGLSRMSANLPATAAASSFHGALVLHGVFGTLIPLERAVALREPWAFGAPIASLIGSVLLLLTLPAHGWALYGLSALWFAAVSVRILILQTAPFTFALLLGALALVAADALLLIGREIPEIVALWLTFLVLTVAAERLELSRLLKHPLVVVALFFCAALGLLGGATIGGIESPLFGIGLVAMALWMLRYDIAMQTVRLSGRVRYFAASMLSGHCWLLLAGLAVLAAPWLANPYDLIIHAICLGFALSMVFGHALIILPAITGIRLTYSAWLYLPLAALQLSVCLRALGDSLDQPVGRLESGYLTVSALLLFAAILAGRRPRRPLLSDQPGDH
jgi:hypothetical protein